MRNKYVVFKDDDAGKGFLNLKRWVDIVVEHDAKGTIGVIVRYLKDPTLVNYLNSLDSAKIEVFCHGFSHSYIPFLLKRVIGRNRILPTEFDRDLDSHDNSLQRYRSLERKHLKTKAISFGPPGNIWNENAVDSLPENDFKMMFSWKKLDGDIFTIPISESLKQDSLEEFVTYYNKKKNDLIFTLQFHHADLTEEQFNLIPEVIDFLKNEEKRIFVNPSDLLGLVEQDDELSSVMTTKKEW